MLVIFIKAFRALVPLSEAAQLQNYHAPHVLPQNVEQFSLHICIPKMIS